MKIVCSDPCLDVPLPTKADRVWHVIEKGHQVPRGSLRCLLGVHIFPRNQGVLGPYTPYRKIWCLGCGRHINFTKLGRLKIDLRILVRLLIEMLFKKETA